jgi:hypothetical protein
MSLGTAKAQVTTVPSAHAEGELVECSASLHGLQSQTTGSRCQHWNLLPVIFSKYLNLFCALISLLENRYKNNTSPIRVVGFKLVYAKCGI